MALIGEDLSRKTQGEEPCGRGGSGCGTVSCCDYTIESWGH